MLTTGEILQRERKNKNISLEEIEKVTKIRKKNLIAIEQNKWDGFPSKTYILGVIKSYGKYLNLNEEKLAAFFRREYERKEDIAFKTRVSKKHFTPHRKRFFIATLAIVFIIFGIYFGYQIISFFSPPTVTIIEPQKTQFRNEDKIELVGKTEKEAIVLINGERVFLDKDNVFHVNVPLASTKNFITIEVTGANGKKTVVNKVFEKLK